MKLIEFDQSKSVILLSYDEVYILLQCVAGADRLDESETLAIMGKHKNELEALADELNLIKKTMRPG
jgi:hypothetical protein